MSRFNTLLRSVCTVAVVLTLAQVAVAQSIQSVLNFPGAFSGDGGPASLAVTNTSSYFADVQFTFYNADGTLGAGPLNPVSYRIAPRGQIVMRPDEIFGTSKRNGWIQATSSAGGLQGFYFVGDFKNTLEGSESAPPLTEQVIPFIIRRDLNTNVNILVTNPGVQTATGRLILYNVRGDEIAGGGPLNLGPHAQALVPVSLPGAAARVSVSVPVLATAVVEKLGSTMLVSGQTVQAASPRVVPHFTSGSGVDSTLVLTNPTNSPLFALVKLFNDASPANLLATAPITVPAYGSVTQSSGELTGLSFTPTVRGWVRIESASALNGVVIVDSGLGLTSVPMQSAPSDRLLFSRTADNQDLFSQLVLIPASDSTANLSIALSRADGATLAQTNKSISGNAKWLFSIREIFPNAAELGASFLTVRSSVPLNGLEVIGAFSGRLLASVAPQPLGPTFSPPLLSPRIARVSSTDVRPGTQLQVSVTSAGENVSFAFGAAAPISVQSPIGAPFYVEVPQIEPGFVSLRLRVNGVESDSVILHVLDGDGLLTQTLQGRAFYQKLAVTDNGLDTTQTVMIPIRNARVEVVDRSSQTVVSVSETDATGRFSVSAPNQPDLTIRVLSRLRSLDLRVVDNTSASALYTISADVDMSAPPLNLILFDTDRKSGAFNILEAIERGNDLINRADPRIAPPSFTVFWSIRNANRTGDVANGLVGGTFFNLSTNTAYILGDRATDSDEFDDSVILHEYAHMLAVKFSRDDSPGEFHGLGDLLDPRVAWSEGWANFFSSAARNNPIYRDSYGPNGVNVLRYNLEDNVPAGDHPGYWSEASVESLLWDLFHDTPDELDPAVQFDFATIWAAFTDLRNDHFVYLPYFLDHFLARNPESADLVRVMAQSRSIVFLPGMTPSVAYPFPVLLTIGQRVTGQVDSMTTKRANLMTSSHFYTFTTPGGATGIRLDVTGLGPGKNSSANDLDLYLLDLNGRIIDKSNDGRNGQSELISRQALPAGTYVIEVRSYYTVSGTSTVVYNSGDYRLVVLTQ